MKKRMVRLDARTSTGIGQKDLLQLEGYANACASTGEPQLSDLWLIVTRDCNLHCPYCFSRPEYMGDSGSMGEATAKGSVDFLVSHSRGRDLAIVFFGGEPLLEMPLIRFTVAYARKAAAHAGKQVDFAITTNGVRLTKEVRRFLIREHFSVMISMDGDRELQDANRPFPDGRGSFDTVAARAHAFIEEALPAGLPITGRTTVNRKHLGRIVSLYHFLEHEMGFTSIWTPLMHHPAPPDLCFVMDDVPVLEMEFEALADQLCERVASGGKLPRWGKPAAFLRAIAEGRPPVPDCAAGRKAICVDPSGDIYPCERFVTMSEYRLGNVNRGGYAKSAIERLCALSARAVPAECQHCEAFAYCHGACAAERLRYRHVNGPGKVACAIYRAVVRTLRSAYLRMDRESLERVLRCGPPAGLAAVRGAH